MFDVYTSIEGRKKTYLVSNEQYHATMNYAKKYFKLPESKITVKCGWVLNDELYLEDPHKKGSHKHWVAFTNCGKEGK